MSRNIRGLCVVLSFALLPSVVPAQEMASADAGVALPNAPESQQAAANPSAATPPVPEDKQSKRILGIFPNFRAVDANVHLPPQSVKEKFTTASEDSFDYSAFVLPLLLSAEGEATDATPEFHQGAAGFGRYFWHTYTDQTIENYMVEFIGPTLTREDTRYYTLGKNGGNGLKRMGYALSRAVVTRSDAGKPTFNISEVVGAGAAAGIANLYYPRPERTLGNTVSKWGVNVGIDAGTFIIREFWPDVNHVLFHSHASDPVTAP